MISCPYCESEVSDDINFCSECYRQAKCIKCGAALKKDAPICLVCGASAVETAATTIKPENRYSLEEEITQDSAKRKIDLALTDEAIKSGVEFLNGKFALPLQGKSLSLPKDGSKEPLALPPIEIEEVKDVDLEDVSVEDTNNAIRAEATSQGAVRGVSVEEGSEKTVAASLFTERDGVLLLRKRDLGGETKREQQERFIKLYVWAYPLILGKNLPDRSHINTAARRLNIHDGMFNTYLQNVLTEYGDEDDSGVTLMPAVESDLHSLAATIVRGEVKQGFNYWDKSGKKSDRGGRVNKDDKKVVTELLKANSQYEGVDTRILKYAWHWAGFALYDITKEMGLQSSVKAAVAYLYLTERYENVDVKKKSFVDSLSRHDDYFGRDVEGKYFLETKGEKAIEELLNQAPASNESN